MDSIPTLPNPSLLTSEVTWALGLPCSNQHREATAHGIMPVLCPTRADCSHHTAQPSSSQGHLGPDHLAPCLLAAVTFADFLCLFLVWAKFKYIPILRGPIGHFCLFLVIVRPPLSVTQTLA